MKQVLSLSLLLVCVSVSLATRCDFHALQRSLHEKKINLATYTARYTDCISPKVQPANTVQTQYGFQPSCSTDTPVTQAIAKFNNQGTFKAADGKDYPFHVRGVVTFTEIDSQHTRIKAVVSGTHSFLFDSDQFSLHVHQKGEINPTCTSTGGHYNPCGKNHSNDASVEDRHVGDVAKVTIPSQFTADSILEFEMIDTQVKLSGPLSVLGRSVTVHGGSGATRVGCATIAVTEWDGVDHIDSTYDITNPFWS